jgi:ubiquinone/menaquinone biosynthesis C-methylase UbiE
MHDHKQWVSGIFDRAAPEYGKGSSSFFNYFGKRLVEQVPVSSGYHGLDVATGKGAILFPLAHAVGPLGKVVGIDISPHMLKETVKEVKEKNIDWVELRQIDAEHLTFPDNCFDVVFCGFALFFLPSISTALSEFKRVLKPGGRLAVSTWGNDSKLDELINEETKKLCETKSLTATHLWSQEELQKVLNDARFNSIQIVEETKVFFHKTSEEWWGSLWNHGTRARLEQLTTEQIAILREKVIPKADVLNNGQGIPDDLQVFYGFAQKN